jgi:hypothetical protein
MPRFLSSRNAGSVAVIPSLSRPMVLLSQNLPQLLTRNVNRSHTIDNQQVTVLVKQSEAELSFLLFPIALNHFVPLFSVYFFDRSVVTF